MNVAWSSRFLVERWVFLLVLLLSSVSASAGGDRFVIDDFHGLDITVSDPEVVKAVPVNSDLEVSLVCSDRSERIVRIPLQRTVKDQKLRLTIAGFDRLPFLGKFETTESGEAVPNSYENYALDFQKGPILFSLDNKYHENLSLWIKCRGVRADVTGVLRIDKIEIVPLEFTDDRDFAYILAAILMLLFMLPGFLVYSVLFEGGGKEKLLALLTPLSIFFFVLLYLVLVVAQNWSQTLDSRVLVSVYLALNLTSVAWLAARKRLGVLLSNFLLIRLEVLAVFIVVLCVAAIVTKNLELPLYTISHHHMRYLTYGAFGAHDPMFQYVNGIAILHDEPFSKYYENYKLFYDVQDRGIIAGVLYAVMRGIAEPLGAGIAYSYGFYTLFGSVLNILALFPIFALHKYFSAGKSRPLLVLLLISASPFLLTNYYLTWFKLAGAGLVISGLVVLLLDKNSIKPWIAAGVIWGLAANFHPSLALSFPVLTIWLLYRFWRGRGRRFLPVLGAFFTLIGVFVAMNMPWSIVKATHFEDTNKLFREHFLASQPYDEEHGILGSVRQFTGRYTLEEQLSERYERLQNSFRIEETKSVFELAEKGMWRQMLVAWNLLEAAYSVYVFAVLVMLFVASNLLTRLLPAVSWRKPLTRHRSDFCWLLATQMLNIFLIIFISFGKYKPDLTWNMPMGSLVIVLYMMVHANVASSKLGAGVIVVYSLFTYYRLFFQYF